MAQAAQRISKTSEIIHILRGNGDELATMTRWLARKEIKAEWKRMGRQITYVDTITFWVLFGIRLLGPCQSSADLPSIIGVGVVECSYIHRISDTLFELRYGQPD